MQMAVPTGQGTSVVAHADAQTAQIAQTAKSFVGPLCSIHGNHIARHCPPAELGSRQQAAVVRASHSRSTSHMKAAVTVHSLSSHHQAPSALPGVPVPPAQNCPSGCPVAQCVQVEGVTRSFHSKLGHTRACGAEECNQAHLQVQGWGNRLGTLLLNK
jgi:hypothetical protein